MTLMKYPGLAVLMLLSTIAGAADIKLDDVWARATPPGARTGAAYFTVHNTGAADRLVAAASIVAETVEVHTHEHKDGMMQMRHVPVLDIAQNSTVEFRPGGLHVMLIGLVAPLQAGDEFQLTLTFEQAGEITVPVRIVDARRESP